LQADGSVFVHQKKPIRNDTYSLVLQPGSKGITGLRLEVLADPRLPRGGPGWGDNGNFVLSELTLQAAPAGGVDRARSIELRDATADFSQVSGGPWPVRGAVDGNGKTGWAVGPEVGKDHTAVFEVAEDVGDGQSARWTVRLIHQYGTPDRVLGRFRLSFAGDRATLQATRIRLDLKDSELMDCHLALGNAHAQQGHTSEAAAAFNRARELAPDRASRARIIAAAAPPEGVLEALSALAAGDAPFQAELARHFAERGNVPLADAARTKARAGFEERLAKDPEDPAWAAELADLLLMDTTRWTVLKPLEMTSNSGVAFSVREDQSVFVGGKHAVRDVYSVDFREVPRGFRAIRLEAMRDDGLPNGGPGTYGGGEFVLSEFRVFRPEDAQASGGKPISLRSACATFEERPAQQSLEVGASGWSISGGTGRSQTAYFAVGGVEEERVSDRLRVLLEFSHVPASGTPATLGRFRLSISADSDAFDREKRRLAATKPSDPWARLAAAYRLAGDRKALDGLLEHRPAAAVGIGEMYAADKEWERAIAEYRKLLTVRPNDGYALAKLAEACQAAGRTREAVPHLAALSAANPKDTALLLKVAAFQAWFAQQKDYAVTRRRALATAEGTEDVGLAERTAKAVSLLPSPDRADVEAALVLARTAVTVAHGGRYNLLALGMAEYRSGNDAAAEEALLAAEKYESPAWLPGMAAFYRAMSLFRRGKPDEARKLAAEAAARMEPFPQDMENPLAAKGPDVAGNRNADDLMLWLACKEAKALIRFIGAPAASPSARDAK
jgi:tetratricopeptide (TPR) repeat protein